mmetsp:Transcript_74905/g.162006  ORF Transcript_74905/g.162006 Transcript_74905/m.162006 type:complete len:270 (+) Transcript_74905:58-867(+)
MTVRRAPLGLGLACAALVAVLGQRRAAFVPLTEGRSLPAPARAAAGAAQPLATVQLQAEESSAGFAIRALGAGVAALALFAGRSAAPAEKKARVVMFARSPFPTAPVGSRGKRRQTAGRKAFWRGRQVSVRVNFKTNKPIKYRMHVKEGDTVQVVKGKDAGTVTKVIKVYPKFNKILCLGVNFCIHHVRPQREDEVGQRVQVEAPMSATNVMHYSEKESVAGHLGIRYETIKAKSGQDKLVKVRYNKATGETIPKRRAAKWIPVLDREE